MAKIKGRKMQTQRQHNDVLNTKTTQRCVIEEETKVLGIKPLCRPPSDQ